MRRVGRYIILVFLMSAIVLWGARNRPKRDQRRASQFVEAASSSTRPIAADANTNVRRTRSVVTPEPPVAFDSDGQQAPSAHDANGVPSTSARETPVGRAAVLASDDDDPVARRRYRVRWGSAGLCAGDEPDKPRTRAALLSRFRPVPDDVLNVVADGAVDAYGVALTMDSMRRALSIIEPWYSPPAPPPPVVIYKDVEQLLSGACVSGAAVAYYDGTLHVAADTRLGPEHVQQSVMHELVHHALLQRGVHEPMWLQEGLAMNVAGESWWLEPSLGLLRWAENAHLPFASMVRAFPHTADERFATAAYFQSRVMVETLLQAHGVARVQALVEALARHEVTPADAFSWALGGVGDAEQTRMWRKTVESLQRLND